MLSLVIYLSNIQSASLLIIMRLADVHETDGERWFTVLNPWVGSPPVLDGGKSLDQRVSALELNQRNSEWTLCGNDPLNRESSPFRYGKC